MDCESVCRLCNIKCGTSTINVFTKNISGLPLGSILNLHYNWLDIKRGDGQSKSICQNCFNNTETFHLFYLNVQQVFNESQIDLKKDQAIILSINAECMDKEQEQPNITGETYLEIPLEECNNDFDDEDLINETISNHTQLSEPSEQKGKNEASSEDEEIYFFYSLDCDICKQKFNSMPNLRHHMTRIHNKKPYVKCCNRKFYAKTLMVDHMKLHINPDAFKCEECGKVFINSQQLKLHSFKHAPDEEKIFKCHTCSKGFIKQSLLDQHLKLTHIDENRKIFICNQCGLKFAYQSLLNHHIKSVHELKKICICHICGKVFKTKSLCDNHCKMTHSTVDTSIKCSICNSVHKNKKSLHSHMRRMHEDAPTNCDICGKIERNKKLLQEHITKVHKALWHPCTYCDKSFRKPIHLKEHIATHTGIDLYSCPYCHKTCKSLANAIKHRKKSHPLQYGEDQKKKFEQKNKI